MKYEIGQEIKISLVGTITKIEGDFQDGEIRYSINGGHCVTAVVTKDKINGVVKCKKDTSLVKSN